MFSDVLRKFQNYLSHYKYIISSNKVKNYTIFFYLEKDKKYLMLLR